MLKKDLLRYTQYVDGGMLKKTICCYRSPGVHAIITYRFGRWLRGKNILVRLLLEPFFLFYYHRVRSKWGIEIPRNAQIAAGLYVGHYGGIFISPEAKIGENFSISQQVTIGESGRGEKKGVPIIGDNVYVAPGAKVFGKITIGNNVKIGANCVIHKDLSENSIVALDPGHKVISTRGNKKK